MQIQQIFRSLSNAIFYLTIRLHPQLLKSTFINDEVAFLREEINGIYTPNRSKKEPNMHVLLLWTLCM